MTLGRVFSKRSDADTEDESDELLEGEVQEVDDADSEPGKHTPSTGSEFELLEKSVDELGRGKASGSSQKQKATKRKTTKKK